MDIGHVVPHLKAVFKLIKNIPFSFFNFQVIKFLVKTRLIKCVSYCRRRRSRCRSRIGKRRIDVYIEPVDLKRERKNHKSDS